MVIMTKEERKAKFEAAMNKSLAEAEEARRHAEKAKAEHRKSDYWFWMDAFNIAKDEAEYFSIEYLRA